MDAVGVGPLAGLDHLDHGFGTWAHRTPPEVRRAAATRDWREFVLYVGFELLGRTVTLRPTLPVARRIVEAHAGVLDVESAPAAGSTFRVRLPPV
jgi:hypothetical protein